MLGAPVTLGDSAAPAQPHPYFQGVPTHHQDMDAMPAGPA